MAWTGEQVQRRGRDVVLHNARPFSTGLPPGFPDLFGFRTVTITPDMVGQAIGIFCGIEVKTRSGRLTKEQAHMQGFFREHHCRVGVARCIEDAVAILEGRLL